MKAKLLTSLLKAIVTGIVENYNPYANAALVMICFQQCLSDFSNILKAALHELYQLMPHAAVSSMNS